MPIFLKETTLKVKADFNDLHNELKRTGKITNEVENELESIKKALNQINDEGSLKRIIQRMNTLADSAGYVRERFQRVNQESIKTRKGFNLLRATAASLAGNIGSNLVFSLEEAIVNLAKTGIEAQRLETRFLAFADSIEQGQIQYEQYFDIANRLGVAFEPIIELGTQFRAVGFEAEEAADLIERLTISAGGSVVAVAGIGKSLRQIRAGKVELEELNPIAEAGVPIFKLLSDELGITEKALRELLETGDVTRETFFKAFRTFTDEGSKARTAADKTARTLSASFQRIGNSANQLGKNIIQAISGDAIPILEALNDAIIAISDNIEKVAERKEALPIREEVNEQYGIPRGQQETIGPIGSNENEIRRELFRLLEREAQTERLLIKLREKANTTFGRGNLILLARIKILEAELATQKLSTSAQDTYLRKWLEATKTIEEGADGTEAITENQKNLNAFIQKTEQLETKRLIDIKGINRQKELGLITEEERKNQIDAINKAAISDLIKLNVEVNKHIDGISEVDFHAANWSGLLSNISGQQVVISNQIQKIDYDLQGIIERARDFWMVNKEVESVIMQQDSIYRDHIQKLNEMNRIHEVHKGYSASINMDFVRNRDLLDQEITIYEKHIRSQAKIRELEDERTMALIENDSLLNQGIITYDAYKGRIETINTEFLTGTNKVVLSIKEWADTIDDPALRARVLEFLDKMKEKQDSLTQNTSGGSLLGPSRFEGTGGANISDPISEGGGTVLEPWWTGVEEFVDGPTFGKIEEGINIAIDGFDALGQIIKNGANAELDALNLKLKELQEQNRVERERIQEQYEKEIEGIQIAYDLAKTNASDLRDQKIADAQEELKEGKLTAKQLADEKNKFEREHAATVKKLNDDAKKQREAAKKQRKEDLKELKNAEIDVQNEIRQKKYEADIQAFHFNQALRYSQIFIEGAIAFVRAIPDPFAMAASVASTIIGAGIISSASPPPKPGPIPKYAEGGYVDKPTLLIAGEGGEGEYIIPESQIGHYKGMPSITINVDGSVLTNGEDIVELVKETLEEHY